MREHLSGPSVSAHFSARSPAALYISLRVERGIIRVGHTAVRINQAHTISITCTGLCPAERKEKNHEKTIINRKNTSHERTE